ncbi:MAG: PD-(D/E)XK nuclease family protein [Akkermansiaceae bacterium]|nr:PD-(D/E)XK nuclease family protein [Akkermansiaceae bacterium]
MLAQGSLNFEQEPVPIREFLGWDTPLLEAVAQWLLSDGNRKELASTMVVVPTSNSGRRLRMALSADCGVLSPHVVPPSRLFEVDNAATRQESLWAWVQVIRQLDMADFPHLFPNHEPGATASFSAALAVARQLVTLRDMLADGDASFQDAQFHSPEKERWEELEKIENRMLQYIRTWGLSDAVLAKRGKAKSPDVPPGVTRIVVACVPDPTLLAARALQSLLAKGLPVTVLIHAPESEKDAFDPWGVPLPGVWAKRSIDIPDWQQRLHVVDSSTEAAGVCVRVLGEEKTASGDVALALCDPTFAPALDQVFADASWPLYNPEGLSLSDSGILSLLRVMRELTGRGRPFEALRELVRLPGAELFLPDRTQRYRAAKLMDGLYVNHLPETLADALFLASDAEKPVLESVISHLDRLVSGKLTEVLRGWLSQWLAAADADVAAAVEPGLAEALEALERLETIGEAPAAQDVFEMLAESVQSARVSVERAATVLDLQGWLEISYDPAPHLILAGMHEECVPDGSADDLFVPDSLREKLGLRDSHGRFARDAYLLQAALKSRARGGRVDAVVARFNDAGEARKPARLLMRQSGQELAAIVRHLFAESKSDQSTGGAWQRDWTLKLPEFENLYASKPLKPLSPSAIRNYLDCPFRFFLKHIVKMETFESGKREMNAMEFGKLCHAVVEAFGRDASMVDSTKAEEINAYFSTLLDDIMKRQHGSQINLPLMVQLESARERLRAFASVQAADRAEGWSIVATEFRVEPENLPWSIAGHPMRMTIDRIDRHEDGKRWRVWDYKTSGKAKNPEETHQVPWKESENRPMLGDLLPPKRKNGSERRWADVQLPLYAAFVQQHYKTDDLPQVGYVNLPRAVNDVAFSPWVGFDQPVLDHALSWAEAAIEKIRAGEFFQAAVYPSNMREWDDFEQLAPDGLAKAFGL